MQRLLEVTDFGVDAKSLFDPVAIRIAVKLRL
jgi:hypothetical protein